jgi:hypothetical protein
VLTCETVVLKPTNLGIIPPHRLDECMWECRWSSVWLS